MSRVPFTWQGEDMWVMKDVVNVLDMIASYGGQDEADDFLLAYVGVCGEHAATGNVAFMLHLMESSHPESARSLRDLFGIDPDPLQIHQTFGATSYGIPKKKDEIALTAED